MSPAAFRRLCVETANRRTNGFAPNPAAFRRLCVETSRFDSSKKTGTVQPPSGGCVLKLLTAVAMLLICAQPPSGGCVLKQRSGQGVMVAQVPAAFRRLCVETGHTVAACGDDFPAAFRRLCVETLPNVQRWLICPPAAFRRLCVETRKHTS